METTKKLTNAQLQKKIQKAVVFVENTKETRSVYFTDKGVRLTANSQQAVISTNYHRHVFDRWTSSGESHPYAMTTMIIAIMLEQKDITSYAELLHRLKEDESKNVEYLIAYYYQMWLYNIFCPLYEISNPANPIVEGSGMSEAEYFMTYCSYVSNVAKTSLILSERKEDVTNKGFLNAWLDKIKYLTENIEESVILKKESEEETAQKEVEAMDETESEEVMQASLKAQAETQKEKDGEQ